MRGGQSIKGLGLLAVHGPKQAGGHGCSTKHQGALSPATHAAAAHALRRAPCHGPNGNACDCSQPPQDLCAPPSVSSSLRPTSRSRCMCRKQALLPVLCLTRSQGQNLGVLARRFNKGTASLARCATRGATPATPLADDIPARGGHARFGGQAGPADAGGGWH